MQSLEDALLDSWDRQVRIVTNLANAVTEDVKDATSGEGEWPIGQHLCHIHLVRYDWLGQVDPQAIIDLPKTWAQVDGDWVLSNDLDEIRSALDQSAARIRSVMAEKLSQPGKAGPYDHPVLFLQHMIWHEGWHVGSIIRTLRAAAKEPSDEWQEANIWSNWRTEEA